MCAYFKFTFVHTNMYKKVVYMYIKFLSYLVRLLTNLIDLTNLRSFDLFKPLNIFDNFYNPQLFMCIILIVLVPTCACCVIMHLLNYYVRLIVLQC